MATPAEVDAAYALFNRLRDDRFCRYSERQAFHMAIDTLPPLAAATRAKETRAKPPASLSNIGTESRG